MIRQHSKLDSKKNLPLLSMATHKNSQYRNKQFLYTGMLQYPLLHTQKQVIIFIPKKKLDWTANCLLNQKPHNVTELVLEFYPENNVTEWNQSCHNQFFKCVYPSSCLDTSKMHALDKTSSVVLSIPHAETVKLVSVWKW